VAHLPFWLLLATLLAACGAREIDGVPLALDVGDGGVGIVPPSGQDFLRFYPRQERDRLRLVARRAAGEEELQWVAQRIDQHLQLGAEAPARAPERLRRLAAVFVGAPTAPACARTIAASIVTRCRSGSSATRANRRSQTPRSSQRAKRLYTLFQAPYTAGSSRHCAPLRSIQ